MNASMQENRPIVEMARVTKVYPPDVVAVQDVSFSVRKGEILFIIGKSGAGKSTLLKLLCCLEIPTKGLIEVAGRDLSKISAAGIQRMRQKIGVAYQDFKLLPRLTAMQNIAMAMEVTYQDTGFIKKRVEELLEILHLADKRDKPAGKLSRGEQQRVALARAAANSPPLILADEPTGNLDPEITGHVMRLFNHLNENGSTILIATHDQSLYQQTNHRILELRDGQLTDSTPMQLVVEAPC